MGTYKCRFLNAIKVKTNGNSARRFDRTSVIIKAKVKIKIFALV